MEEISQLFYVKKESSFFGGKKWLEFIYFYQKSLIYIGKKYRTLDSIVTVHVFQLRSSKVRR